MEELSKHRSIMIEEVAHGLALGGGKTYLDGTFGAGGHSIVMLEKSAPDGKVIAFDRDLEVERFATAIKKKYGERFRFYAQSYAEVGELGMEFDGALLDLGFSSDQLEDSGRGFSFQKLDEPLDLRFDARGGQTAAQLLQQAPVTALERIFREYGEDRYAKRLASKITETRRSETIRTVGDFVTLVGTTEPAVLARLFQALRLEVNRELEELERGLHVIKDALKPGAVLAVITFHSLEDRIVKQFMRDQMTVITKKPITPSNVEIEQNPRSRSAKLRLAAKE